MPTTTCTPDFSARSSAPTSAPPTHAVTRAPASSQESSRATWWASSRVGATTSASGLPGLCSGSRSAAIARPNATVLPEPVRALTMRSRPRASSRWTASCTGVGVSYPRAASAAASGSGAPRVAKSVVIAPFRAARGAIRQALQFYES